MDIDALVAEIAAGGNDLIFDLSGDAIIDTSDLDQWLVEAGLINQPNGEPYFYGDADLDGVVDVGDFNIWNNNKFSSIAAWSHADFTADGQVDASDFNRWNSNKFRIPASVVPEPSGLGLILGFLLLSIRRSPGDCRRSK